VEDLVDNTIECFFIGHNEIPFDQYEKDLRTMGTHSGAYRELNLNFIMYNNKPYSATEIFNLFNNDEAHHLQKSQKSSMCRHLKSYSTFSNAIAYLGTYLNRRGYTFDYVNSFRDEQEKLAEKLVSRKILTIAIITTFYISPLPIIEIIKFIKKYNQTAKIVVGGPFVFTKYRTLETPELHYLLNMIGADIYVNSFQGEATLSAIINSLKNNKPPDNIPNIYFKSGGGLISTPIQKENNLLAENLVNWNLFAGDLTKSVNVRASISCPFSCAFCGFPERAGKYQALGAEKIEKELNMIDETGTIKSVTFIDDTFNFPVSRFKDTLKMIIKNRYRFKWRSNLRCQFVDEELVELMKKSGCEGVFLGIESGNNTILKNMNKAAKVEKYLEGIELLKKHEIFTYGSFIIGFPGETDATAMDTLNFIKESELDFFQVLQWYCEPITPIYRQKEKYGLTGENFEWQHKTMNAAEAADWVEKIFLSVEKSAWIPQYNFSLDNFLDTQTGEMKIEILKNFLRAFSQGIKEKLKNPLQKEISFKLIKQLKQACEIGNQNSKSINEKTIGVDKEQVKFNF